MTGGNARIVPLKSGSPGPCLFIIPGIGGRVEGLMNFGALLRTPMPVLAIEPRGVDGSSPPDTEIEEMAKANLAQVQTVQATGPYFLAGHSSGGLVAFEMAQRLIEAKEKVACLLLLDTGLSQRYWPLFYYLKIIEGRWHGHLMMLLTIPARDKTKYFMHNLRKFLRGLYDPYGLKRMPIDVTIASRIAGDRYCPKFYSDKVIFFRASVEEIPADPEALWRNRVSDLEIQSATGGHNTMLDLPNVSRLADDISACLMKASADAALALAPQQRGRPKKSAV